MKTIVFIALYKAGVFFALKNINLFHPFFAVTVPRNRMELQIFSTKLSACIKRVKLHCNIKCWSSNIRQMAKNDYRGNSHNYSKQMMTWEVRGCTNLEEKSCFWNLMLSYQSPSNFVQCILSIVTFFFHCDILYMWKQLFHYCHNMLLPLWHQWHRSWLAVLTTIQLPRNKTEKWNSVVSTNL